MVMVLSPKAQADSSVPLLCASDIISNHTNGIRRSLMSLFVCSTQFSHRGIPVHIGSPHLECCNPQN